MLTSFFKKSETDLKGHPFKKLYESTTGAQLIDVRTAEEVFTGPIAGATNIICLRILKNALRHLMHPKPISFTAAAGAAVRRL